MKTFKYTDEPFKLYGVPFFENKLVRLPETLIEELGEKVYGRLGRRCPGARIKFKTNSKKFGIKILFGTLSIDRGMSAYACHSAAVYVGTYPQQKFYGLATLKSYDEKVCEGTILTNGEMQEVTVFLPRNEHIDEILFTFADEDIVEKAEPYKYEKPIVFYGPSITEGGCCCNVANAYPTLVSRKLDIDFINLGFSGAAVGQLAMAEYINKIDMSIFVLDYDHNAPTVEHLEKTHEPFFKKVREAHPDLPIIMMTRPYSALTDNDDTAERRQIVRKTYENAVNNGDKNVYFIDGADFFGEYGESCLVDGIHPNDLGFVLIAQKVIPVIENILQTKK